VPADGVTSRLTVSGRSRDWIKIKNPAPAVKREAEEGWGT